MHEITTFTWPTASTHHAVAVLRSLVPSCVCFSLQHRRRTQCALRSKLQTAMRRWQFWKIQSAPPSAQCGPSHGAAIKQTRRAQAMCADMLTLGHGRQWCAVAKNGLQRPPGLAPLLEQAALGHVQSLTTPFHVGDGLVDEFLGQLLGYASQPGPKLCACLCLAIFQTLSAFRMRRSTSLQTA